MMSSISSRLTALYQNKLAIIAGGSEGIGLAIAEQLVRLGSGVWIGSRDAAKLTGAAQALERHRRSAQQRIIAETLDVTAGEATRARLLSIVERFGAPHFLINAAGIAHPGYFEAAELSALREMMEVNYWGTVNTVRALMPAMRAAGGGHIVNIASMAGYLGLFGYTGYCASKYAVVGFSWALRHEVRPYGIQVSVLCPPNTRTPGLARENQVKPPEILKMEQRAKTASADEVAEALLHALPKKRFIINATWDSRVIYAAMRWMPTAWADLLLRRSI